MLDKYFLLLAFTVSFGSAYNVITYTYKAVGDVQIQLDVYTPFLPAPSSGYPVFLAIHGGSYISGSKDEALVGKELSEVLSRGWVAVSINYRLIPGVVLQEVVEDIQDAYNWVRTELVKKTPINPDLITVFGRSAGGGLAVLSGYKLSPRPQAVIGFYSGMTNWTEPFLYNPSTPVDPLLAATANKLSVPVLTEYTSSKTADPRRALLMSAEAQGKAAWLGVTHDPDMPSEQVLAILRDLSAAESVDKDYPPTYLAHGTADTAVPYIQSVQLANSLKLNSIPHALDLVPNMGHDFDLNANVWEQHVLPAFDFVQKYMQTAIEEVQMELLGK